MRYLLPAALLSVSLGGCATGYLLDRFEGREKIIAPQLPRFGLDQAQTTCVSERLARSLSYGSMRQLERQAAAITRGLREAGRLTMNELTVAANNVGSPHVREELDAALTGCGVQGGTLASVAAPRTTAGAPAPETTTPGAAPEGPAMSGGVPVDTTPLSPAAPAASGVSSTWLNLGAADSGQSIAIDALSIQQEGAARTAWFRMTDPETGSPTNNFYRLRIDCDARTVQPLALRQTDAAGAQLSLREYTPAEATPGPAEAGTVLEIAFLSLCT